MLGATPAFAESADGAPAGERGERQRQEAEDDAPPAERTERRRREPPYESSVVRGVTTQPASSIRVEVRYDVTYGYKAESGAFGGTGPTSCDAFSVVPTPEQPPPADRPVVISRNAQMVESGGAYVCEFLLSVLPLGKVTVETRVHEDDLTAPWRGGTQSQPPSGWRREIADGTRVVTLTDAEPRGSLSLVMRYAPTPDFVAPRRKNPLFER